MSRRPIFLGAFFLLYLAASWEVRSQSPQPQQKAAQAEQRPINRQSDEPNRPISQPLSLERTSSVRSLPAPPTELSPTGKVVDLRADVLQPKRVGDSSVISLAGNVVFYHNGAVVSCDSAVRYNDHTLECFSNVMINQGTTYAYGDRLEYNGNTNMAHIYSPLVKVIDQDAIFYSYNFSFNTLKNIGHYSGGGTMHQGENRLESEEGFYYANTRELVAVGNVEMENAEKMQMRLDTVHYNMDTEVASFTSRSYIWNANDEFLTAKRGEYDRKLEKYTFTDSSYVMTKTQEIWADTLLYIRELGDAILLNNVQVVDHEQKSIALCDFLRYWGQEQKAVLTQNPVLISFEQGKDTTYMRADSMFLYTVNLMDSVRQKEAVLHDSLIQDSLLRIGLPLSVSRSDSLARDSLIRDSALRASLPALSTLPEANHQTQTPENRMPSQGSQEPSGPELLPPLSETLPTVELQGALPISTQHPGRERQVRQKKVHDQEGEMVEHHDTLDSESDEESHEHFHAEDRAHPKEMPNLSAKEARAQARQAKQGRRRAAFLELQREVSLKDSLAKADSLALRPDSLVVGQFTDSTDLIPANSPTRLKDSLVRQVYAYHNVKIFRQDFQAVCDSLTGFSLDSTLHMYIHPVMWNQQDQITAKEVDIYLQERLIDRAVFTGEPIMSSPIDTTYYNQIKGRQIEALFSKGEIYEVLIDGNSQTYYYLVEEDSTERYVTGFVSIESASTSFRFKNREIEAIAWMGEEEYLIYPIHLIPEESPRLAGFTWQEDRRPTLEDVYTRMARPSQREDFEQLAKPTYAITEKINRHKEQITKERRWVDRVDELGAEAQEFVRNLGQ